MVLQIMSLGYCIIYNVSKLLTWQTQYKTGALLRSKNTFDHIYNIPFMITFKNNPTENLKTYI